MKSNAPIGIFDSGVGGVSVLCRAAELLPGEDFIYYGDTANAPYGLKSPEAIRELSFNCAAYLTGRHVKALLVACNTATSAAIKDIREAYPIPVVSMEPAVKPACERAKDKTVLVMATPATLKQKRYLELVGRMPYPEQVMPVPCGELVSLVEQNGLSGGQIQAYVVDRLSAFAKSDVRAIVLGCTHFVFVRDAIQKAAKALWKNNVTVLDGNLGTARQLKAVLEQRDMLNPRSHGGSITFHSSGEHSAVEFMSALFDQFSQ